MFLLLALLVTGGGAEQSSQYLKSAIDDLKDINSRRTQRRNDRLGNVKDNIPTLSLTRHDLAKLYQTAVKKGQTVSLDSHSGPHMEAAVYEIEDPKYNNYDEDSSAYYYYYYPLKTFMDELNSEPDDKDFGGHKFSHEYLDSSNLHPQYFASIHHNVSAS